MNISGQGPGFIIFPPLNDIGYQVITEFAFGVNHRLVKTVIPKAAIVIDLHIAHQRQTVHLWHQRAQPGTDGIRQHGHRLTGEVNGGGALTRQGFGSAALVDECARVRNGY